MTAGAYLADITIPSLPPAQYLLRRLDGRLEAEIAPDQLGTMTRLLAALLTTPAGEPVDVAALATAVHDRLLANVYLAELGPTVSCRAACDRCAEAFEFSFPLAALLARQDEAARIVGPPGEDGCWVADDGTTLRPPTLADAQGDGADALLARLAGRPVTAGEAEAMSAFLEEVSPLMSLDIETRCPECAAAQQVWFDLPRFMAQALAAERPFLIRETHLIAARYGWSHDEILALSRTDRRAFAALIESERSAALRRAS